MAGIGQSSVPPSDQSSPWNSSQFSMGRSTTIDNHTSVSNKFFPLLEKRRMMPEENGVLSQNIYQYNRQQTGFQSSNVMPNDKSFPPNMQNPLASGSSSINYNMYQRTVGGDPSLYSLNNLDMSSQSKQGFNSSSRPGIMPQYFDQSSHSYLSPAPHRTISSGSMNSNAGIFNGQNMSKSRPGSYNLDSHTASQWDSPIGNFDVSEFPSLKTKPNTLQMQMSSGSSYNYSLPNKSVGQINYQMVTKSGMPITPGENTSEFSIQQEDFPALPVAHNPVTCAESQRSSSALGVNATTAALNSGDNSSQSHNSSSTLPPPSHCTTDISVVDSSDFINQKMYPNTLSEPHRMDQVPMMLPVTLSSHMSATNNSSQPHTKVQKKISQGPNNFISNIPKGMVADAFGLIGLVKLIAINDTYENLNLLAPGVETLSLNRELDSNKDIFHSYVSPLSSNSAGRPQDMDFPVPKEYRIHHMLAERLADPLPDKLSDETLFWIFYNLTGEECQLVAARQLMNRQWRYNKRERFWLTRDPNGVEPVTHPSFERGCYLVWDWDKAKRVSKPLTVYYKDLDNATQTSTKLALPFCYPCPKRPPLVGAQLARPPAVLLTPSQGPMEPVRAGQHAPPVVITTTQQSSQ